jgi:hypothetical protein
MISYHFVREVFVVSLRFLPSQSLGLKRLPIKRCSESNIDQAVGTSTHAHKFPQAIPVCFKRPHILNHMLHHTNQSLLSMSRPPLALSRNHPEDDWWRAGEKGPTYSMTHHCSNCSNDIFAGCFAGRDLGIYEVDGNLLVSKLFSCFILVGFFYSPLKAEISCQIG